MGLFGGIKNMLFGGGGSKGYTSRYTPQYETGARSGVMNRAGARVTGKDAKGNDVYDFSGVGQPVSAGNQGYDFSNLDKAISGFSGASSYTPKNYTAANFEGLPEEYYQAAYEGGATDVRREGAGQLEKLRETIGPQRAGLLLKAGQGSQRSIAENLAKMRSGLGQEQMRQKKDLALAQAEENYRAAGFNDEQARFKAQDELQRTQGLSEASQGKLGLQSRATENERAYQDQALQYLLDMFYKSAGLQGQAADRKNQTRGQDLEFISSLVPGN